MSTSLRNAYEAPVDQSDFYRQYFGYVVRFVQKYGYIHPQDAEDVANSIWVRLLARDVLGQFDPDFKIEHGGVRYKAKFETYLAKMLDLYVRHYRTQQNLRAKREVFIEAEGDAGALFDVLLGGTDSAAIYEGLEEQLLVQNLTTYLRRVPPRAVHDALDLERLFLCVAAQARLGDARVHVGELAQVLGATPGTVRTWLKVLRGHVQDCLDGKILPPLPGPVVPVIPRVRLGGVVVTVDELEAAYAKLAADGTNMIRQPLARADNPLATCDYHGVIAAYRTARPDFAPVRVGLGAGRSAGAKETFMAALADTIARYQ